MQIFVVSSSRDSWFTMMGRRNICATAILAFFCLATLTNAFAPQSMEARRIQRQQQQKQQMQLGAHQSSTISPNAITKTLAAILTAGWLLVSSPLPSLADGSRVIGELQGSGLVFKDTLLVESFEDPKVKGVTLYISNFQRPLTERLSKDFFNDPSSASVSCAKTGKIQIADNIAMGKSGEEVFEESRSLLFKTLRVQRIYDKEKNTMVYVSFNTRLDKNQDSNKSRFQSSTCAVSL